MSHKLTHKTHLKLPQAITYLEEIVKHLKEGKAVIQRGEDFVTLIPAELISLEIEASSKKDKAHLAIELKWRQGSEEDDSEGDLLVSAAEPPEANTEPAGE